MGIYKDSGEYLDVLSAGDLGVNVMAFVGHGTIHRAVLGDELRAGEPDEVDAMARLAQTLLKLDGCGVLIHMTQCSIFCWRKVKT